MPKKKIVVFGASGFIGSALCERLYGGGALFRAAINTFASSARIARLPIEIVQANLLDYSGVREAVRGCNYIVNCAWGSEAAMLKGLQNVIRASKEERAEGLIHVGSISVHEGYADLETISEDDAPKPVGLYGRIKERQDRMVFALHRDGVPSLVLAAGRVVGPYSNFLLRAVERAKSGPIVLVDEGRYPSNHVHVDNLSEAIVAALRSTGAWGQRYFITEPERPTWRDFYREMHRTLGLDFVPVSVSRQDVLRNASASVGPRRNYVLETLRGMASAQFRQGLSAIPAFNALNEYGYKVFTGLRPAIQDQIRSRLERPIVITKNAPSIDLADPFLLEQTRRTFFGPAKFMTRVGYLPILTDQEGMQSIQSWYEYANLSRVPAGKTD